MLYKRKEMEGGGRERVFSKQVKKVLGCIQPHVIQVASLKIDYPPAQHSSIPSPDDSFRAPEKLFGGGVDDRWA
jgi:hypothetical protein